MRPSVFKARRKKNKIFLSAYHMPSTKLEVLWIFS